MTDPTLVFLDLETTGLDPDRHDIWEIGAIVRGSDPEWDGEWLWQLRPDLATADPTGLRISRYYEREMLGRLPETTAVELAAPDQGRRPVRKVTPADVAHRLARLLDGAHIVGAVPSFDAAFLAPFLRKHGQAPTWHYHLVDVEAMAAGYLHGGAWVVERRLGPDAGTRPRATAALPWRSDELTAAVGATVASEADRHTALGDARWAMSTFDAITGYAPVGEDGAR
jgi:hypothetical protein